MFERSVASRCLAPFLGLLGTFPAACPVANRFVAEWPSPATSPTKTRRSLPHVLTASLSTPNSGVLSLNTLHFFTRSIYLFLASVVLQSIVHYLLPFPAHEYSFL